MRQRFASAEAMASLVRSMRLGRVPKLPVSGLGAQFLIQSVGYPTCPVISWAQLMVLDFISLPVLPETLSLVRKPERTGGPSMGLLWQAKATEQVP